jgi:hypothetical protein
MKKKKRSPWQTLSDEGLDMHRKSTDEKKWCFKEYVELACEVGSKRYQKSLIFGN